MFVVFILFSFKAQDKKRKFSGKNYLSTDEQTNTVDVVHVAHTNLLAQIPWTDINVFSYITYFE